MDGLNSTTRSLLIHITCSYFILSQDFTSLSDISKCTLNNLSLQHYLTNAAAFLIGGNIKSQATMIKNIIGF